jgi:tetratricopeptide (TPR) repeat protein
MKTYETATIAELARPDGWSPIRRELDVQAFGINAWTGDETLIPEHDEVPSGHEELYIVVAGRASFDVGGDEIDAPAGTIVFVRDPAAKRGAAAVEPGTTVLAVGARPGAAYRPRSWETNVEAFPLFEAGRFDELKALMLDALDRYEDRGALLYNLACAETLLGERDAALEHLAAAIEERPDLRDNAREDGDLESIRDDPRFPA